MPGVVPHSLSLGGGTASSNPASSTFRRTTSQPLSLLSGANDTAPPSSLIVACTAAARPRSPTRSPRQTAGRLGPPRSGRLRREPARAAARRAPARSNRSDDIARAKKLMATPMPQVEPAAAPDTAGPDATPDHRPPCPCCGGRMIIVEIFARGGQPRGPPPPAPGSRFDCDDYSCRLVAAFARRNISFPASRPFCPGACERWHDITDQSAITPPSTAAATRLLSSAVRSSRQSSQNHPRLQPLHRQIPIDSQALTALPRVRSSEAWPLYPGRSLTPGRHPKP